MLGQVNSTTIKVSWEAPRDSPAAITGYQLHYVVDGDTVSVQVPESTNEWFITLDEDQSHDITVSVQSLSGSIASVEASVEIPQGT